MAKNQVQERDWDIAQAKLFVKQVREQVGDAWGWLDPRCRRALIAERALNVIRSQHRESVKVAAMDVLLRDMLRIAGLEHVESES